MLRLSIVIPVLGDLKPLDDTLVSILENRPANCELLVVHNTPYDDPYGLAGEVQFVQAPEGAGFVECLNLGLSASRAPVVHLLACGVEVRPGWAEAALRHFRNPEVAAVAPVLLHHDDHQTVVSAGLGYRAEGVVWRVGRGRTPDEVGEDRRRALRAGRPGRLLPPIGHRSGRRIFAVAGRHAGDDRGGAVASTGRIPLRRRAGLPGEGKLAAARDKVGFRHGCHSERLFWRWASAHGRVRSVAAHAALVAGECVVGLWRPFMLLQLAGRAVGVIHAVMAKRRSKTCEEADDEPAIISSPHFGVARPVGEEQIASATSRVTQSRSLALGTASNSVHCRRCNAWRLARGIVDVLVALPPHRDRGSSRQFVLLSSWPDAAQSFECRRSRRSISLHFGDDIIQRHVCKQLFPFLGVVAVAGGELADESHGVHDTDFPAQHPQGILRYFRQGFASLIIG